jgi:SAM-dependent methyltransferase
MRFNGTIQSFALFPFYFRVFGRALRPPWRCADFPRNRKNAISGDTIMTAQWQNNDYVSHYAKYYNTPEMEFIELAGRLNLDSEDCLVDFGCGDGTFLFCCAQHIGSGIGIDLSEHQVTAARERLKNQPHIAVCQSAFLEFNYQDKSFTKGFSRKALHHLTDPEKEIFFEKAGSAFMKDSLFLIEDAIFFDFERANLENHWEELMREASVYYGAAWAHKQKDVTECFRLEFPTGMDSWLKALKTGGFTVIETKRACSFYGSILAQKR